MRPEADIQLNLLERSANDPKQTVGIEMNIKALGLVSTALFLSSGCATALTPEAGQIRIVESKSEHDCTFVTTLSASDVGGFLWARATV